MDESREAHRSLVLAATEIGAEFGARLVRGSATSQVVEDIASDGTVSSAARSADEVFVSTAGAELGWIAAALDLARESRPAGSGIHIVVGPSGFGAEAVELLSKAFAGWTVQAVAVDREVVVLTLRTSSEAVDSEVTGESILGAVGLAELLGMLLSPSSAGMEDFQYRSSLMMTYLREVPRLHVQIDSLERELRVGRAEGERLKEALHAATLGGSANPTSIDSHRAEPNPLPPDGPFTGRPRWRSLQTRWLLLMGALLAAGVAGLVLALLDWDPATTLSGLTLVAITVLIFDHRRRAIHAQRRSAAVLQRVERSSTSSARDMGSLRLDIDRQSTASRAAFDRIFESETDRRLLERRLFDEIDRARGELGEASRKTSAALGAVPKNRDIRNIVRDELLTTFHQLEAELNLRDLVDVTGAVPPLRGWAASPDVLLRLVGELRAQPPKLIVECGSGASTVWLAMAMRSLDLDARIVALEHDEVFAEATREVLRRCGVAQFVDVRGAPMEPADLDHYDGPWYAQESCRDLDEIGLLFVDGPPGIFGPLVRYPALPLLYPHMARSTIVVLDDTIRDDEQRVAARWAEEFPEFAIEMLALEKGAAILRRQ